MCLPAGLPLQTTSSSEGRDLRAHLEPSALSTIPLPRRPSVNGTVSTIIVHLGAAYPDADPLVQERVDARHSPAKANP